MKISKSAFLKKLSNAMQSPDGKARLSFFISLVVLTWVWWQGTQWYRAQLLTEQRIQVTEQVALRGSALSAAINRRYALLRGLQAFVKTEALQDDFAENFQVYAASLYANTPGLLNIAAAPDGIVRYIYPPEGNKNVLGYDLLHASSLDLQEDVQLAIETEEIILGFPLDYAQEGWGLAARRAVYLDDGRFWGLISVVIDISTLLRESGLDVESPDLDFRLVDRSNEMIFETGPALGKDVIIYELSLPEEPWRLSGYPKEDWDVIIRPNLLPIQLSGIMIVLLVSSLVYSSVNRQGRLAAAVQQRTQEIVSINRSLEHRVAARTRELTTLLEISQNVATISNVQPLLSVILDQLQGIVTYIAAAVFLKENPNHLALLAYRGPLNRESLPSLWPLDRAEHYREVLQNGKPVIIPNVDAETHLARAWRQMIDKQLGGVPDYIRCWLGVPLVVQKRVIGLLVLHHQEINFYTQEHASLVLAFAYQAALAIENTRLYEQAQQLAVFRERQRIARELHDSVSQALYSIALGARTAQTLMDRTLSDDVRRNLMEPIAHVLILAEAGLAEMRALIFELRPESLENEGVVAALSKQAAAIQARHGLVVQSDLCDEPIISLDLKLLLYRVAQEALHNIVKHAQAEHVDIALTCQEKWVSLKIQDDGRGFDPKIPFQGLGLRSMQERVSQVNGQFDLVSEPGKGTSISVKIPLEEDTSEPI